MLNSLYNVFTCTIGESCSFLAEQAEIRVITGEGTMETTLIEFIDYLHNVKRASVNTELSYKRDLLWAALSVIEYLVEMCQMEEAQRILKEIAGCNGLCPEALDNTSNNSGCGCGS